MNPLIDRLWEINRQIRQLEEEAKNIKEEIWTEHEPGEVVLGEGGYGYELTIQKKLKYGDDAIQFLRERLLLHHFASISTAKIDACLKDGYLLPSEGEHLRQTATVQEIKVLREYVPAEAKVIA